MRRQNVNGGALTGGPKCKCGNRDWFQKGDNRWVCSNCTRERKAQPYGIILDGPQCKCGKKDWFVGKSIYRCSRCSRARDKS